MCECWRGDRGDLRRGLGWWRIELRGTKMGRGGQEGAAAPERLISCACVDRGRWSWQNTRSYIIRAKRERAMEDG